MVLRRCGDKISLFRLMRNRMIRAAKGALGGHVEKEISGEKTSCVLGDRGRASHAFAFVFARKTRKTR